MTVSGISGDGSIGLNLTDDDSVVDSAGNELGGSGTGNGNFAGESYTIDQTAPGVTITSAVSGATNVSPIPLTITFSEPVAEFDIGDITASGGTLGGFSGAGAGYSVELTPSGDGPLTLDIAAGVAGDPAGNTNTAAPTFAITYDATAPEISSVLRASGSPTGETSVDYTVNFSEPVSEIDASDFDLTMTGTVTGLVTEVSSATGTSVTVTVSSVTGTGTLRLNVAASATLTDAAGNALSGGYSGGEVYDVDHDFAVVTSIGRTSASPSKAATVDFAVTFSEAVTGVDLNDFALAFSGTASGTISNVSGSGLSYTVTVGSISGDGTLGLNLVDDDSIIDAASTPLGGVGVGDGSFAGDVYTIDQTGPSVGISSAAGDPTNQSPISVALSFSEPVLDFKVGDILVSGGTLANFTGSGADYSVELSPAGDGTLTVDVGGAVASDAAGNANTSAAQFSIGYDVTAPQVTSITRVTGPRRARPSVDYSVTFSEPVFEVDVIGLCPSSDRHGHRDGLLRKRGGDELCGIGDRCQRRRNAGTELAGRR